MQRMMILHTIAAVLLCAVHAAAQQQAAPPTGITLLPGFKHERNPNGIDSESGRIWKDQGLSIRYSLGASPGRAINLRPDNLLWTKEQVLGWNRIQVSMTRDRMLIVVFPAKYRPIPPNLAQMYPGTSAYFYATVSSDEDVTEVLFMVLGYEPPPIPKD